MPARTISEVVVLTINNVPAEITHPANVWREANFQAGAQLTDRLPAGRGNMSQDRCRWISSWHRFYKRTRI